MALFNWPPVLIWLPLVRLPAFLGLLLWISIPVEQFGLDRLAGGKLYERQSYGINPENTLAWALIVIFWILAAAVCTLLTVLVQNKIKSLKEPSGTNQNPG